MKYMLGRSYLPESAGCGGSCRLLAKAVVRYFTCSDVPESPGGGAGIGG